MDDELLPCICGNKPKIILTNARWVGHGYNYGYTKNEGKLGCKQCGLTNINSSSIDIIFNKEKDEYEFQFDWVIKQQIENWNKFISKLKKQINDSK